MAQQTINVGTAPNDGTGTPLRTAFQYTNSNFSELYTAVGPSGNNIVVPGNATITGDLTVDTSTLKVDSANNRVGIGTASPAHLFDVLATGAITATSSFAMARITGASAVANDLTLVGPNTSQVRINFGDTDLSSVGEVGYDHSTNRMRFVVNNQQQYTIDPNGVFTWYDGAGGTRMTLNSTGLGVGASPSYKLDVGGGTGNVFIRQNGSSIGGQGGGIFLARAGTEIGGIYHGSWATSGVGPANSVFVGTSTAEVLLLGTNYTERMRIDNSGNVGIGVTPSAWGAAAKSIEGTGGALTYFAGANNQLWLSQNAYWDGAWKYKTTNFASSFQQYLGQHVWFNAPSGTAGNAITFTQAMTLDASGNLLVGTTNTNPAYNAVNGVAVSPTFLSVSNTSGVAGAFNRNNDGIVLYFTRNGTAVGNVSVTAGGTTFNSTSDYRLKEFISPLVGGLARVNALKPSIYKWKSDGSNGEGFLAHELAEVVPLAVTGQKDAVKDDGSIEAQGVDLSRVVPILVAAIQELTARVQTLETR